MALRALSPIAAATSRHSNDDSGMPCTTTTVGRALVAGAVSTQNTPSPSMSCLEPSKVSGRGGFRHANVVVAVVVSVVEGLHGLFLVTGSCCRRSGGYANLGARHTGPLGPGPQLCRHG
jgi:hypothetical protein